MIAIHHIMNVIKHEGASFITSEFGAASLAIFTTSPLGLEHSLGFEKFER